MENNNLEEKHFQDLYKSEKFRAYKGAYIGEFFTLFLGSLVFARIGGLITSVNLGYTANCVKNLQNNS